MWLSTFHLYGMKFALWWPNEWALWFFPHLFIYNGFLIKDSVLLVGGYHGYLFEGSLKGQYYSWGASMWVTCCGVSMCGYHGYP